VRTTGRHTTSLGRPSTTTWVSWDVAPEDLLPSTSTRRLAKAEVPHLVKFKHASDVVSPTPSLNYYGTSALGPAETTGGNEVQRGLTSRLTCLFPSGGILLQAHVHYRLVQSEICRSLSEFRDSKHLVSVVLHSLKGENEQTVLPKPPC